MSPNSWQAWTKFWQEAAKGPSAAAAAWPALVAAWPRDEGAFPSGFTPPPTGASVQDYRQWVEQSWAAWGVVPRQQYLEALAQNEALRQRLTEAEQTIERLQSMLAAERGAEVEKVVGAWQTAVQDTLAAQNQWLNMWGLNKDKKQDE
ncbi:MAG TPA: hypothetical protein VLL52_03585 [Anaerolineae bacterium]|nr:hypothetical protein [Anaerolineae bacterium]